MPDYNCAKSVGVQKAVLLSVFCDMKLFICATQVELHDSAAAGLAKQ